MICNSIIGKGTTIGQNIEGEEAKTLSQEKHKQNILL